MKKYNLLKSAVLLLSLTSVCSALPNTQYTSQCKLLAPVQGQYEKSGIPISSQSAFKKITAANQLFADEMYNEAIAALKEIANSSSDKGAVARAHILLGMAYQAVDKSSSAKSSFQNALKTGAMTIQNELSLRLNLAQIAMGEENYKEALSWMNKYFADVIKPPANSYAMLANVYYRQSDFKKTICPAYLAIKEGAKQKKALYSFLFASHFRLEDMAGSEKIAKEMIDLFPTVKNNYSNLRAVFSRQGKQKDMLALAELGYLKNIWVSQSDYKQLAALYYNQGAPLLAAERFQEGLDKSIIESTETNWKTAAYYWSFSKSDTRAIEAYQKAAGFNDKGIYDYKIANIFFLDDNYSQAIKFYDSAIRKGGLKERERGTAYIQKGTSQFRLNQFDSAIATFNSAKDIANVKRQVPQWIRFINQVRDLKKVTSN